MDFFSDSFILVVAGIMIGVILYHNYLKLLNFLYIEQKFRSPLIALEKRGVDIYNFVYRQGDFVVLSFDSNGLVYLDLLKTTVTVYNGQTFLFSTHSTLKKEFDLFYNQLIYKFKKEIYDDVIIINNVTYSKNIFSADTIEVLESDKKEKELYVKSDELTLNDILDKMNNDGGWDSLTDEEKEFMFRQGDDDKDDENKK